MRITVIAVGTEGDVRPLIALAAELQSSGADVTVATHRFFEPLAVGRGLRYSPIKVNPRELVDSQFGREWVGGTNLLRFAKGMTHLAEVIGIELMTEVLAACRGTEAIVTGLLGFFAAAHVAEGVGVPMVAAFLQPVTPSRHMPSLFFSELPGPLPARQLYNAASHRVVELALWSLMRTPINQARQEVLGLPKVPLLGTYANVLRHSLTVYGFSPTVLPQQDDWDEHVAVTGYWFLDEPKTEWQPDEEFVRFLESGPAPVYVGFGSMSSHDEEDLTGTILESLRACDCRGVLATGWGGLKQSDLPDDIIMVDWVPHDWLFPRMAAIVHHGGAGTSATGLRSGVPQVIVPFFADQKFWGARVHQLGAGPSPVPRRQLTVPRLVSALRQAVGDPSVKAQAEQARERIVHEDGLREAVAAVRRSIGW